MNTVLFEDEQWTNLLPMVYFRPAWELRCGAWTLRQKVERHLTPSIKLAARNEMQQFCLDPASLVDNESRKEVKLWLNGRLVFRHEDAAPLQSLQLDQVLVCGGQVVAFYATGAEAGAFRENGVVKSAKVLEARAPRDCAMHLIGYLWDAVTWNGEEIVRDFQKAGQKGLHGQVDEGVHLLNSENIYIAPGARIKPGVVIDAEAGPVWIAKGVTVMPNSVLEGPLYIGENSRIKIGAKIYEKTTIGPFCKIGGEVEGSIIHGYSNKQHDGFLGHAYLGEWVNLGADTNNSDLKNNYGTITALVNGYPVNTGSRFVGLMMGDHSKTAINTMFNTGTIVGVNCNIFGAEMPAKFVPSFTWGNLQDGASYDLEKAVSLAATVMGRRDVTFGARDRQLFEAARHLAKAIEKGSAIQ